MNRATPRVIVFNSISLDGQMDTGDMGLYYQTAAFWKADAMLSGSATMLSAFAGMEDPKENPSGPKELHPLAVPYLVVVDSRGQIHNWRQIQAQPFWQQAVALCSQATPQSYLRELEEAGIPVIVAGEGQVDLADALAQLGARFGIKTVRVDSGGILNGVLLRAGLVDEVSVLLDPCLNGGDASRSFFQNPAGPDGQPVRLRLTHCEPVGEGVLWLRYEVLGGE